MLLIVTACKDNSENADNTTNTTQNDSPAIFNDESIVRHIESVLEIPGTEDYDYAIYRDHLDGDDSVDIVVTVNLLQRAMDYAIERDIVQIKAEEGFMGNYNFIIYIDGATKTFATPLAVPSSPHAKLTLNFENIRSEAYKDIVIDYRIRNACFRRYFAITNGFAREMFDIKIFDGLGDVETEAYEIRYAPGTYSLAKDILVYKATLEDVTITDPKDVYSTNPEITPTGELERTWYYHGVQGKYFTQQ